MQEFSWRALINPLILAKAGTQRALKARKLKISEGDQDWVPAFAGMSGDG